MSAAGKRAPSSASPATVPPTSTPDVSAITAGLFTRYSWTFPIRTVSPNQIRTEHWSKRHKRDKEHKHIVALMMGSASSHILEAMEVHLTRLGPRRLDDDNLAGSLKAVRDAVAHVLGIDDGDPSVRWVYRQERSSGYAVQVHLWHARPG